MSEALELLTPVTISGAKLTGSNVAEPATTGTGADPAAWSSGTTYTQGQQVYLASTHLIYEATSAGGNLNKDPSNAANEAYWTEVGYTNKWRAFDQKSTSQTTRAGSVQFSIAPGEVCSALALVNISGGDVVSLTQTDPTEGVVYSLTESLRAPPTMADYWHYCFDLIEVKDSFFNGGLRSYALATITLTVTANNGTSDVGIGAVVVGRSYRIGLGIQYGARVGIQDYSKKERNPWGDLQITEGAFANRGSFQMWVSRIDVDAVKRLLTRVRAVPCIWRGSPYYDATMLYGIYKDWEFSINFYDVSLLNIERSSPGW
jgi:hypothetical protein